MTSPSGTEVGSTVGGRYRIERLIGQGGMGQVVLARHLITQRPVALKFLLSELAHVPEASARFLNEARAAVQIESEHVARVLDVDVLPSGAPYMVIEYLDGQDLSVALYEAGQLPIQRAVDYVLEACVAIAEAHALGIVHRDLKPGNLFLAKRKDGSTIVKVLDFGIAKALAVTDRGLDAARTRTGGVLGSPPYMSPEQLTAPQTVDVRTDIWALGVVLYELITGLRPFRSEPLSLQIIEIVQQPHVPLERMITGIDPRLSSAIDRCLQKHPHARFPDVAALATALSFAASETGKAAAKKTRALIATAARPELASAGGFDIGDAHTDDQREPLTNVLVRAPREQPEDDTTRRRPAAVPGTEQAVEPATVALASASRQPRSGGSVRLVALALGGCGALGLTAAVVLHLSAPSVPLAPAAPSPSPSVITDGTAAPAATAVSPAPSETAPVPPPETTATASTKRAPDPRGKPATKDAPSSPPAKTGAWGPQH